MRRLVSRLASPCPADLVPRSSDLRSLWFNPDMRRLGFVAVVALAIGGATGCGGDSAAGQTVAAPHMVPEPAGIDHRYDGDFQYFVGGGVAAFDCDDDGRSELFFAGGSEPAALYRNESPIGGALRFAPISSPATDLSAVTGAYPLDIDSDGHTDLAVLRVGEDVLLRGLGGCRFERANEALGFDGGDSWTVGLQRDVGGGPRDAHPGLRRLPHRGSRDVRGQPAAASYWRAVRPGDRADARLLHALDAVQRLAPVGRAGPAPHQRPALLP